MCIPEKESRKFIPTSKYQDRFFHGELPCLSAAEPLTAQPHRAQMTGLSCGGLQTWPDKVTFHPTLSRTQKVGGWMKDSRMALDTARGYDMVV